MCVFSVAGRTIKKNTNNKKMAEALLDKLILGKVFQMLSPG